jgi:hypothetical protein
LHLFSSPSPDCLPQSFIVLIDKRSLRITNRSTSLCAKDVGSPVPIETAPRHMLLLGKFSCLANFFPLRHATRRCTFSSEISSMIDKKRFKRLLKNKQTEMLRNSQTRAERLRLKSEAAVFVRFMLTNIFSALGAVFAGKKRIEGKRGAKNYSSIGSGFLHNHTNRRHGEEEEA